VTRAVAALALAACVNPAEDRARRDQTIGAVTNAAASVAVDDGLAHVRALAPGELTLWASAPSLTWRLTPAQDGEWLVTIANALPDAELDARTSAGTPIPATSEPGGRPTELRFRLSLDAGEQATFTLAPADAADLGPWRFVALADVQDAIDDVGDIYARIAADPAARFVVFSGDLTEMGGDDELDRFEEELAALPVPIYVTPGNHDLGVRDDLFHDHFGRGNYRFVYRGVQFTILDSASATIAPTARDWLAGWLAEGRERFHVVAMHIPPLDPAGVRNGAFASRAEAHSLLSELAEGGVDLTLYGHLHTFIAFENAGIPAFISGGGGAIPERFDGVGRHFLTVDVDPITSRLQTALVRID
jgi:hypothetical protein